MGHAMPCDFETNTKQPLPLPLSLANLGKVWSLHLKLSNSRSLQRLPTSTGKLVMGFSLQSTILSAERQLHNPVISSILLPLNTRSKHQWQTPSLLTFSGPFRADPPASFGESTCCLVHTCGGGGVMSGRAQAY